MEKENRTKYEEFVHADITHTYLHILFVGEEFLRDGFLGGSHTGSGASAGKDSVHLMI